MIVRMAPPPPPEFLPAAAYGEGEPNLSRTVAQSRGRRNCHLSTRKTGVSPWPDQFRPFLSPLSAFATHFVAKAPRRLRGDSGASCADAFQADVSSAFKWASLGRVSSSCKKYCLFPIVQSNAIQLRLLCRCREFPAFHTGFRA